MLIRNNLSQIAKKASLQGFAFLFLSQHSENLPTKVNTQNL